MAVVIDPGSAPEIMRAIEQEGCSLCGILSTHHHGDHTAGIPALIKRWPNAKNIKWEGGEARQNLENFGITMLYTPGHTLDSVCYLAGECLFTGDTMFGAGCGRLFEGSAVQMAASFDIINALPDTTRLYYGHEYTLDDLDFAAFCEPDNPDIKQRRQQTQMMLNKNIPAVGFTLAEERLINPFLRLDTSEIEAFLRRKAADFSNEKAYKFGALREIKDSF